MKPSNRFQLFTLLLILSLPLLAQPPSNSVYEKSVETDPFGPTSPPQDTTPMAETPTAGAPTAARINLKAEVFAEHSGLLLDDIVLEIFMIDEQGNSHRAFTGKSAKGSFTIPLLAGLNHMVVIRKVGYKPESIVLESTSADIEAVYYLSARSEIVEVPGQPMPARASAPEAIEETAKTPIAKPTYKNYELTEATSFRSEPTHKSKVIRRFAVGNQVQLVEQTDQYWWKVRYQGNVGFVKAAKLMASNPRTLEP